MPRERPADMLTIRYWPVPTSVAWFENHSGLISMFAMEPTHAVLHITFLPPYG